MRRKRRPMSLVPISSPMQQQQRSSLLQCDILVSAAKPHIYSLEAWLTTVTITSLVSTLGSFFHLCNVEIFYF